jgi:hypothetical protein
MVENLKTVGDRSENLFVIEPEKHGGLRSAVTMPFPLVAELVTSKEGDNRRGLNG